MEPESSKEEDAFSRWKTKYKWLTLESEDNQFFLGCRECMAKKWQKPKRGFAAGKYTINQYFYERTLQQHVDSAIHKEPHEAEEAAQPEPDSSQPANPLEHTPPRSSAQSSEPASSDRKSSRKMFSNLILAVYMVLKQCASSSMYQSLLAFAQKCGGLIPDSQQSSTVFEECRDLVASRVMATLIQDIKQSPFFSLSVDEKDAMLVILVTFIDSKGCKVTSPLAYKNLSGLEAKDIFALITATLEEHDLPKENLVAFCADGASVMGTRQSMSRQGNNVASKLQDYCGHPLLIQHCAPHRLQLAIESSFHQDDYFKGMEKRIKALFTHLSNSPSTSIDILFWSELTGEDVLTSLNTSTSRWLSWLRPLEKLNASHLTMLAHLMYEFQHHANREQKKTIQWIFHFFNSWEFRLTVAGCIDILRLCFHTKNMLESVKSLTSVNKSAAQLDEALTKYCRKHSILAEALAGNAALPVGGTEAEKIASLYRQQQGQKLRLTYTVVGGAVLDEVVGVKQIETPEHFKEIFTRLKHFGETCKQQVLKRFESKEVWQHADIFDCDFQYSAPRVQNAVHAIASFLKLDTSLSMDEMRSAFAYRDVLLKKQDFGEAEDLWAQVLLEVKSNKLTAAERIVASFLLAPSQAAVCERCFSLSARLLETLGQQTSPQVLFAYMLVAMYGPDSEQASNIISECTTIFFTERKETKQ